MSLSLPSQQSRLSDLSLPLRTRRDQILFKKRGKKQRS